jgi:tetratricopeptide (TPR) repeat protein
MHKQEYAYSRSRSRPAKAIWVACILIGSSTTYAKADTLDQSVELSAVTAYESGRNAEAATLGLTVLGSEPDNYPLRLKVANALAWTEQYPEALRQYRALAGTPLEAEGRLGEANVNLWSGRPHLAVALYRRALESDSTNAEAEEGISKAERQLRPRTSVRIGTMRDSDHSARSTIGVSHQWRDESAEQVYELQGEGGIEQRLPVVQELALRELGFSYENLSLEFSPKLKLTAVESPSSKLFAELALKLADGAIGLEIGHVNWGKMAFNTLALRDGLTADRIAISGRVDSELGRLSGNLSHFEISDGNHIEDAGFQYTPKWQPFPSSSNIKVFTGLYGHLAERDDPRYWTPTKGYYTAFVGTSWGRWEKNWEAYGEVKRSVLIGGVGSGGWNIGLGGKRWLDNDWALRAETFLLDSGRSESVYRSYSVNIALDRVW